VSSCEASEQNTSQRCTVYTSRETDIYSLGDKLSLVWLKYTFPFGSFSFRFNMFCELRRWNSTTLESSTNSSSMDHWAFWKSVCTASICFLALHTPMRSAHHGRNRKWRVIHPQSLCLWDCKLSECFDLYT